MQFFRSKQSSAAYAVLLVTALIWGLNATASKLLYAPSSPVRFDGISLFVARAAWSLPLFVALLAYAVPRARGMRVRKRDWTLLVFSGLCYGPGTTGVFAVAVAATSAAHANLLFSLGPPLTAALAALFFKERLSNLGIAAVTVGLAGAALLTFTRSTTGSAIHGDALMLVWVVALCAQALSLRRLAGEYPPLFIVGAYGTIGTLMLLAFGAALGRLDAVRLPFAADPHTIVWFHVEMVLCLSLLGQLGQMYAIRRLGIGIVTVVGLYGSLLMGVAASLILLGERITLWGYVAGLMLMLSLALALVPSEATALRGRDTGAGPPSARRAVPR